MCIISYSCRYRSNRNKSTNEDRKTDSPSYETVEMQRKDESGRCVSNCEFDEVITQNTNKQHLNVIIHNVTHNVHNIHRNHMARDEVMYEEVDVVKMDSNPAYDKIQFHKSVL